MEFRELIAQRYSVRKFAQKPVEAEKLQAVLEAGRLAPTAKNQQPQRIYVLESPEAVAKIRSLARCAFDAPVVLLVCGDIGAGWVNPFNGRNSTEMDCSIVTSQMMLQAQELGLGTCWVCWYDTQAVKEAFGLPEQEEPFVLMPLGYPAEDCRPARQHDVRKPLEETVRL